MVDSYCSAVRTPNFIIKQDCLSVEASPPANRTHRYAFCSSDLDLDLMTLVYELDLSILRMYLCAKNEVSRQMFSKLRARTGQTDATERITTSHLRVVKLRIQKLQVSVAE